MASDLGKKARQILEERQRQKILRDKADQQQRKEKAETEWKKQTEIIARSEKLYNLFNAIKTGVFADFIQQDAIKVMIFKPKISYIKASKLKADNYYGFDPEQSIIYLDGPEGSGTNLIIATTDNDSFMFGQFHRGEREHAHINPGGTPSSISFSGSYSESQILQELESRLAEYLANHQEAMGYRRWRNYITIGIIVYIIAVILSPL